MRNIIYITILLCFVFVKLTIAQNTEQAMHYFKFAVSDKSEINHITRIVSIDNIKNDTVYAYANTFEFAEFEKLEIPYDLIIESKLAKDVAMASTIQEMQNWDRYPTYELYEEMMQSWANTYSDICVLEEIGTLQSGRKLLALKISDNPQSNFDEEPEVFLSSTMHGDEIGGYSVLLQLTDYLLINYSSDIQNDIYKIINESEIWITPLANPDGAYKGGNSTLSGAIRYNGNYVDLNRNFPDPSSGGNPDGNDYQEETNLMMDFANKHHFALGMNIHSGQEVVNYPWDTWYARTADDDWWKYVGGNYRDSAQANSPAGYLDGVSDGLTHGADWYVIDGGRQDYMNYFKNCREFTLEISIAKLYPASDLPNLWNYNKNAIIGYMLEASNGIHGKITTNKGVPVFAKIEVLNHDVDNSEVYTDSLTGFFTRFLKEGIYDLKITSNDFADVIFSNVDVKDGQQTYIKSIVENNFLKICIDTSKIVKNIYSSVTDSIIIPIINCGNNIQSIKTYFSNVSDTLLLINNNEFTINSQQQNNIIIFTENLIEDTTILYNLTVEADSIYIIPLHVNYIITGEITISKTVINKTLVTNNIVIDSIVFNNFKNQNQEIGISFQPEVTWVNVAENIFTINALDSFILELEINSINVPVGLHKTILQFNNDYKKSIPVYLKVDSTPTIKVENYREFARVYPDSLFSSSFLLTNKGGGVLEYNIKVKDDNLQSIIEIIPSKGVIEKLSTDSITFKIVPNNFEMGNYKTDIEISSRFDTVILPLNIYIDTLLISR